MEERQHHEGLVRGLERQLKAILEGSDQGIYLYLDDIHKVCNKRFASLLGYDSPKEWAKVTEPLEVFVAEGSRETLISAYQTAMERMAASADTIVWKKRDGGEVRTTVILVPVSYEGHLMALHFVS
jgi:PAS domain-containing protein